MAAIGMSATPNRLELNEFRNRLGRYVVDSMQEMVERSNRAQTENRLNEGIWFPRDYISALIENSQSQRLKWLKNKCHLLEGFVDRGLFDEVNDHIDEIRVKQRSWTFTVKDGALPSLALKTAKIGLSILDDGAVCQIARYDALLKMLGEDKFNRLFSSEHGQKMNIGYSIDDDLQPMTYFVAFTKSAMRGEYGSINARGVKVGQILFFQGVSGYDDKHPFGMGEGYNVVCNDETSGSQTYLGLGFASNGVTEEQIAKKMVDEYNLAPDHTSRIPEMLVPGTLATIQQTPKYIKNQKRVVGTTRPTTPGRLQEKFIDN